MEQAVSRLGVCVPVCVCTHVGHTPTEMEGVCCVTAPLPTLALLLRGFPNESPPRGLQSQLGPPSPGSFPARW